MKSLYKICAGNTLLPGSLRIELCYDPTAVAHCRGGFADVWKGEFRGLDVAVKVLRIYATSDFQKITRVSYRRYYPFPRVCGHTDSTSRRGFARSS